MLGTLEAKPKRAARSSRPWIVVGPLPPPLHGVAFSMPHVIEGFRRIDLLAAHLDTSDDRPVYTTNRLDVRNALLALMHSLRLVVLLARHRRAQLYVPISQGRWGFLRDAVLIAIAKLARRPVTLHLHGGHFPAFYAQATGPERWLIRAVLGRVDEAWVLTDGHASLFDGLIDRDRVLILEGTAEDVGLGGPKDAATGRPLRLLFLSNLFPEKGCFDLVDAVESLRGRAGAGLAVRFVGEATPGVDAEMRRRAERLAGSGVSIDYLGPLAGAEKTGQYHWADIFVLPSRYRLEGQPLVLLEAMSAGLPIVTTDHSGIPYTVRDGLEGLIVPKGDVTALAAAISKLAEDAGLRERLGENGRKRYDDSYRNDAFHRAIEALVDPRQDLPVRSALDAPVAD
jgi:glycosyltransferase involved in cell wall biosynthesis